MNNKYSRLGISSTVLWVVVTVFCLYLWLLTQDKNYVMSLGNSTEVIKSRLLGLVALILLSSLVGSIISLILGIVGIRRAKAKNILFAKIGTGLSIASLVGVVVTFFVLRG